MVRFLIGWITIVAIFASSIPWELVPSLTSDDARAEAMSLSDAPDCPGEEAPGQPCEDDGCLCPCCPTLVPSLEVLAVSELQPPVEVQQAHFPYTHALVPAGVYFRVFHPPRLV